PRTRRGAAAESTCNLRGGRRSERGRASCCQYNARSDAELAFEVAADDRVGGGGDLGEHHADLLGPRVVHPLVDVGDAALDFEDEVLADGQDEVERVGFLEPLGVLGEEAERMDGALLVAGADV